MRAFFSPQIVVVHELFGPRKTRLGTIRLCGLFSRSLLCGLGKSGGSAPFLGTAPRQQLATFSVIVYHRFSPWRDLAAFCDEPGVFIVRDVLAKSFSTEHCRCARCRQYLATLPRAEVFRRSIRYGWGSTIRGMSVRRSAIKCPAPGPIPNPCPLNPAAK